MNTVRKIAISAVLCAMSVVLTRFLSFQIPIAGFPVIRIGFGSLPIIIAGIMCGPLCGAVVGACADLFGCLINLMGTAYFPGFTLSAALTGVIPAVLIRYIFANPARPRIMPAPLAITIGVVVNEILVSFALNTTWLAILYGQGWVVLGIPRIVSVICMIIINSTLSTVVLRALKGLPLQGIYNPFLLAGRTSLSASDKQGSIS